MNSAHFSTLPLISESYTRTAINFRNVMFEKFRKHITQLLEQKKARSVPSRKGILNTRKVHQYAYTDNVFLKNIRSASSDCTIVFLIDGSGSMSSLTDTVSGSMSCIAMCGAIASAFAKANHVVLKDKISMEVFVKSAPQVQSPKNLTATDNGSFVSLSRVFSSQAKVKDFDRLCGLQARSPIQNGNTSSYTAEYAVLPALIKWIKKNVKTKNCIVFNLTDGDTFCNLGSSYFEFRNQDTKAMRLKYLRGIPNVTLMIGRQGNVDGMRDIFGDNMIIANDDFSNALFRVFAGFIQ